MKNSYKKMLIFQIVIFLIFVLNSFVSNILREYNFIVLLVLALIAFKLLFGFERDRHRYVKDIIFEVVIFLLSFFILFYIFGLIIGFARINNYYTWYGMRQFVIPLFGSIILKEILRYMMLVKCENSKLLLVTTYILFIFLDITNAVYYTDFTSEYDAFMFIALTLLPALSSNLACSYISIKTGYKPVILYLLVTRLYAYLIPIIPDPNEYLTAIINFLLPAALAYKLYLFFEKTKDKEVERDKPKVNVVTLVIASIFMAVVVYFTSGYFHYYAIAVGSGSMEPVIYKGDVVIVEKIEDEYDKLEVGQVIAFDYSGVIVVHRLVNIVMDNNHYYFYTKGDANYSPDNYAISEDMIIGVVNHKIRYIGLPTVWLSEK